MSLTSTAREPSMQSTLDFLWCNLVRAIQRELYVKTDVVTQNQFH